MRFIRVSSEEIRSNADMNTNGMHRITAAQTLSSLQGRKIAASALRDGRESLLKRCAGREGGRLQMSKITLQLHPSRAQKFLKYYVSG